MSLRSLAFRIDARGLAGERVGACINDGSRTGLPEHYRSASFDVREWIVPRAKLFGLPDRDDTVTYTIRGTVEVQN